MDSNLSLSFGFKGQLKLNAQVIPMQEGYLKLGGIVAASETNGLKFGVVVSADPATPDQFEAGCASGNIVRGVCVFDDSIAQNAPAHPDKYLTGMPAAALNHGFMWLAGWDTSAGLAAPVIGCKVVYNDTNGKIGFVAASASAPSGYTELTNAQVRSFDADNGALIYIN